MPTGSDPVLAALLLLLTKTLDPLLWAEAKERQLRRKSHICGQKKEVPHLWAEAKEEQQRRRSSS